MSGIPAGAGQLLGKRLGKYEILALLALGGTAEIYLARIGGAAGFEKYVVVKCLHDHLADDTDFVKMFLDEARLAAHLDHSNIVQTMELGEHDSRYYMVMEFLAGLSLAMVVRRASERLPGARIPVPLVLNILAQSCAGLHYAHEKAMNGKALNIVHRDISPQNLVVSFEGVVKLVDFGIAKAELRETRTRSGTIKGKFAYMSPEQCVANNVDRRTDVFALGVIGHELLTGQRLFKRPSPYETYQAVMECSVKPPSVLDPALDPALDPVIMRAVSKDRADRYPTAEAFGDALLGYLHHRGIGSGPGDVSRFFDAHFGQEIDEHSGRMRELIAGRDVSVETGVTWGSEAEDDRRDAEEPAGRPSQPPGDVAGRQSAGAMSLGLDDLGGGAREGDDEMPAERTRIEANPLERINELERLSGRAATVQGDGPTQLAPSDAVPIPPPVGQVAPPGPPAMAGPGAATPAPGPSPASPPGMPPSGRFPDLANLPTMIAGDAPPVLPPRPSPPPAGLQAHAPTQIAPMPVAASGSPAFGGGPPGMPLRPQGGSVPPPVAQGYPVMNAQMSEQIATGATVFPSEPSRGGAPHPGPPMPAPPPARGSEPGRPSDGYPPRPPDGYPPRPPDGGMPGGMPGGMIDAQRAAGVMSPVGQQYPENVDWGSVAASRARAVPPWLLAALFIGAIGIALALTVVVARLIR